MQKRTIFLTSTIILLSGIITYQSIAASEANKNYNSLQDKFHASQIAFQTKEEGYKHEIISLKKLLLTNRSSLKEREKQIEKISLANKELEQERNNLAYIEYELNHIQDEIKNCKSKITKADMPDLNDTSKITNIDIDVINEKFKNRKIGISQKEQHDLFVSNLVLQKIAKHKKAA